MEQSKDNLVYVGKDNISSVYLFKKNEDRKDFGIAGYIRADDNNTIDLMRADNCFLDFTNKSTDRYLILGWSGIEEGGTWADSEKSYLYLKLLNQYDYKVRIESKPLYDVNE